MFPNTSQGDGPAVFGHAWNFANCEFDDSSMELRVGGVPVDLELKPLEVLLQLLIHPGEVISKERLLHSVWPGLMVVDGSLATAVSKLRKALGDADSSIVLTIPRVGYRLGVPVRSRQVLDSPAEATLSFRPGDSVPGREHWRMVRALPTPESREVWLAENPKTHELRVFKFALRGGRLKSLKREVTVSRFLRESLGERADFGRLLEWNFDKQPYSLEIEYGGPNLVEWAESQGDLGKIPLVTRLRLLADVASAVADAHQAGVVHKDLKPANILVASGAQIKVVDFGSASLSAPERLQALGITNLGLTQTAGPQTSSLTGTLLYLAPEVLSGQASTASADVYALGVILYQIVAGDFRRPLSPGWEAEVEDPLLREDIAQAAHGDPRKRLGSAAELAARLRNLDRRRAELHRLEQEKARHELARQEKADARARRPWIALAVGALVLAITLSVGLYTKTLSSSPRTPSVAILPFHNTGSDTSLDFLRFALADEVATTLNHMRPLIIRPLASAAQYSGPIVDLQRAGREMSASSVVAGHYLKVGDQLQVSMEAVDVASNRTLWRDTFNVEASNLLSMQQQIAAVTQGKLAPALGASVDVKYPAPPPKNEQAYALYLQSLPMAVDEVPNRQALILLQRSVELEPNYAPTWSAIMERSYAASRFGRGGRAMLDQSDAAAQRALALDPDHLEATVFLSQNLAERGELVKAYQLAKKLADSRPDSPGAHHQLSYVLRYAGLVDESGRECDLAFLLDPQTVWGPCSSTFMEAGNYPRAMNFIRKDFSSEWSKAHAIEIFLRNGNETRALELGPPKIAQWSSYKMLLACARRKSSSDVSVLAADVPVDDDPEVVYFVAGHFAYCGQREQAFRMLRHAIEANYCSYPALDRDPMFASLRNDTEFEAIRSQAVRCQESFLSALRHPVQ